MCPSTLPFSSHTNALPLPPQPLPRHRGPCHLAAVDPLSRFYVLINSFSLCCFLIIPQMTNCNSRLIGLCWGLNFAPQNILTFWPLIPVNMVLFGNGVFADVIKLREVILEKSGPYSKVTDVLTRRERTQTCRLCHQKRRDTDTQDMTRVMHLQARNARDCLPHQKLRERHRTDCPLEPSEGLLSCWHLDFGPVASITVREYISFILSLPFVVICYDSLRKLTQSPSLCICLTALLHLSYNFQNNLSKMHICSCHFLFSFSITVHIQYHVSFRFTTVIRHLYTLQSGPLISPVPTCHFLI